jgi:hypothetical protein
VERREINLATTLTDLMISMSEGNPGAITIMTSMMKEDPVHGILLILNLDDMNIRGTQIWIGYKDYCGEDIEKFMEAIKKRDPAMVDVINRVGLQGNHKEMAVTSGASFDGRKFLSKKPKEETNVKVP